MHMNRRQQREFASLDSARGHLRRTKGLTPSLAAALEELEAACERLKVIAATQMNSRGGRRGDGVRIYNARRDLRVDHMLPIARIGKIRLKGFPGIEESLRVPHAKAPSSELLKAAKRIADAVRPHKKEFLKARFSGTFITRLERAAVALEQTLGSPDTIGNRASGATRDLKTELADGRKLLGSIDSLFMAKFRHDKDAVSLWRQAKRIPGQLGRPRQKKPPKPLPPLPPDDVPGQDEEPPEAT